MNMTISPIYKKVLVIAIILWVASVTYMLSDLYVKSVQQDVKSGRIVEYIKNIAQVPTTPAK